LAPRSGRTYQSWFLWEQRLKNFRSIRRGIATVVAEIEAGNFGNVYKGSSLEKVVGSIAEQRQIFKGADHAFLWQPKLRISDIFPRQTEQCLKNIESALRQAGSSLKDVVRVTYVLPDGAGFEQCWPVLRKYFGEVRPAAMIISAGLADPRMKIEIEVTALKGSQA